jgi:hypothetical protein
MANNSETIQTGSRFFPSRVQSPVQNVKLIACSWAVISSGSVSGTTVLSNGQVVPNLPNGVASITRTSTGLWTIVLAEQYKSVVSVVPSVQVATPSSTAVTASYTWTDATDTDSVQFLAGPNFAGTLGNNLAIVVNVGVALANTVTYSGGVTTVTLTTAATTTPAQLKTYVNTTAASTLGGTMTIGTTSGTTAFSVGLSSQALTGGVAATSALVAQVGAVALTTSSGTAGTSVQVRTVAPVSGSVTDLAVATGNNINVNILVKVR